METNGSLMVLTSYLRSLSVSEPFVNDSPTGVQLPEWHPRQSFAESMTADKKMVERCSDDFSYFTFNREAVDKFLPPVELAVSERCGRFLRATRDIEAGETIFWEHPLVLAPKGGSGPVCLDCFRHLPAKDWPVCSGCKGPRCEDGCQGSEHSPVECDMLRSAFANKDISTDVQLVKKLNIILTPLRTHLAIRECPSIDGIVWGLQSNAIERKRSAIGEFVDKFVVPFIRDNIDDDVSSAFIHHVCGIFDTNAFDVTIGSKGQARALLPLAALMNHSCISNTQHWFYGGFCVFRASVLIPKGDPVVNTYTQTLWGTTMRQNHLALTKLFSCDCARCIDPTELDTHLSSIQCQKCQNDQAFLVPGMSITSPWVCSSCGDKFPSSSARNLVKIASNFASRAEVMDIEDLQKIITKLNTMLGRQHYTSVQLQFLYIKRSVENLQNAKETDLLGVLSTSDFLVSILNTIEPGKTRLKGFMWLQKLKAITRLVSLISQQSSGLEVVKNLIENKKFVEELDREAEECEDILKWDILKDDVQEMRRQWSIAKENIKNIK